MNEVFARDPGAVAVVESALIFEVVRDARARGEQEGVLADWRRRIDRIIVVTAPDESKSPATRPASAQPARPAKLRKPMPASASPTRFPMPKRPRSADYVIDNQGDIGELRAQIVALWQLLEAESNNSRQNLSLE